MKGKQRGMLVLMQKEKKGNSQKVNKKYEVFHLQKAEGTYERQAVEGHILCKRQEKRLTKGKLKKETSRAKGRGKETYKR